MAVDYSKIEGALNSKMEEEFTDIEVVFDNQGTTDGVPEDPPDPDGDPGIEVHFLPSVSSPIEVGSSGRERAIGIYQIDIRVPLYSGKYGMYAVLGRVLNIFERGTSLTYGSVKTRIIASYPGPALKEDPYYRMPVTINWQSDQ